LFGISADRRVIIIVADRKEKHANSSTGIKDTGAEELRSTLAVVASTVALALIGVVLWGTLAGSMLPFALRRLGFDPATSSAPFVATLVDVSGLIIYFSIAAVILSGSLLR
jgi:Mg/Co/Ni transporter MgtE